MFEYLISLLAFTLPLCTYGLVHKKYRKTILEVGIISFIIGAIWDNIASNMLRLWSYNPDTMLNVWLLGLPLEELLFVVLTSMSTATLALLIYDRNFKAHTLNLSKRDK